MVDDSITMQAVLEQFLADRLGLDVVGFASDVDTAVAIIADLMPDLVTIDFRTLEIDGKRLLEKLATLPPMHKIFISGHACADLKIVSTLEQHGASACLEKVEIYQNPARFCGKILAALNKPKRGAIPLPVVDTAALPQAGPNPILANHYPIPLDEQARLEHLAVLNLANDDEDAEFDRLTALLGRITEFPTCLMTFIDGEHQWIKSAYGFTRGSMPRAIAICNYTLCSDEMFAISDLTLDSRFSSHDYVVNTPCVRSYIGHPITSRSGVRLGAICLLDNRPRQISPAITSSLRSICEIAAGIIDTRPIPLKKIA